MLERTRNVYPRTVRSQNALIDAMEKNETIIYIVGSYANEIKNKAIANKATKGLFGGLKTFGAVGILINPILGLSILGLSSLSDAMTDNFRNYKIQIDEKKNRIVLTKTKGKNAYRPKLDTIIG